MPSDFSSDPVTHGSALLGVVAASAKREALKLAVCRDTSLNGVLGVECSNHSVPTILFNDLATFSVAFSFLPPMTFRVTLGFTVSPAGAHDFLPAFPPALQLTAFTSACTNIAWGAVSVGCLTRLRSHTLSLPCLCILPCPLLSRFDLALLRYLGSPW